MGYTTAIIAVAAILIGSLWAFGMQRDTNDADDELNQYHFKTISRDASLTGLNLTVRKLVEDTNWVAHAPVGTPDPLALGDRVPLDFYGYNATPHKAASFDVNVWLEGNGKNPPCGRSDQVLVLSNGATAPAGHATYARYEKEYDCDALPPATKKAIVVEEKLTLHGSIIIEPSDDLGNADIHSNETIAITGKNVRVYGMATYANDSGVPKPITKATENHIGTTIQPNADVNGPEPNLHEHPHIDIPVLDPELYRPGATLISGDTTLTGGVIDFEVLAPGYGTEENPFVWFVDGDLDITGNTQFIGYGLFVIVGETTISGDIQADLSPEGTLNLGFYSAGALTVSGNVDVMGLLYSNTDILLNGNVTVTGGLMSAGGINTQNGNPHIIYTQVSKSSWLPGATVTLLEGIRMIAYSEW